MAGSARSERLLLLAVSLTALLGPTLAVTVVPSAVAGWTSTLVAGTVAQLAAAALVVLLPRHPQAGFGAVVVVALL